VRSIRWTIAILITLAAAIAYFDRLAPALVTDAIRQTIPLSAADLGTLHSLFYFGYALMYLGGGRLTDWLGTRRGFLLIVVWWSLACAAHGLARVFFVLAAARLMLGLAQGGLFPTGAKAVAEWFPARERGTAMGMFNGGSAIGPVLAPLLVAMMWWATWPWVFYLGGAAGLLWCVWWLWEYYPPAQHPRISAAERREIAEVLSSAPRPRSGASWWRLLLLVEVWGVVIGKFFCDAVWFTHVLWLPEYLRNMHGFSDGQARMTALIPYAASGLGSVFGGWCSGQLLRRGYSLGFARKAVLGASAAVMPCMWLLTRVPAWADVALYSMAFFAHLSFSTLVLTLAADLFPRGMVGSVVGLVGFGGSMGGVFLNKLAGWLVHGLGPQSGYPWLFGVSGSFHIVAFVWILLTVRHVRPLPAYVTPAETQGGAADGADIVQGAG
jgi:ACS family hexuronate transporter-like MFS transporter